jgi:N-acetylglutamate synthase-like GNAT family acetyltransferase
MTTYVVRPARPGDARAMDSLARTVRREHQAAQVSAEQRSVPGFVEQLWVVEAGRGEIVGCCGVRELDGGVWELHRLFLAAEWRGFGLGKSLVEQAIHAVAEWGGLVVLCQCPPEFTQAAALLENLQFVLETPVTPQAAPRYALYLGSAN